VVDDVKTTIHTLTHMLLTSQRMDVLLNPYQVLIKEAQHSAEAQVSRLHRDHCVGKTARYGNSNDDGCSAFHDRGEVGPLPVT